jgi:uncharacterized protein YjbJ (UPF0337 family)
MFCRFFAPWFARGGIGQAHLLLDQRYWRNLAPASDTMEPNMNKDQVKGVGEQIKGKVNEAVGKATNNPGKELKGDLQQGAGKVQKAYGDGKEQAKDDAKRSH